jgi:hypothetical protein
MTPSRLVGPAVAAAVAAGGVLLLALVDPNEPGRYPRCPFLALTGLPCPGCGSLRAMHALATGDLATAVGSNVLLVLAVPALLVLWGTWLRARLTGGRLRALPARAVVAAVAVLIGFGVLRNLPWGSALAP